jgi:hypothetical protein
LTDETDETDDRLAELERRLGRIEDERAIERMIASYGPLVDAGEADATAGLWAVDGGYDVEEWPMRSRDDVAAMVRSDAHQGRIARGCSHSSDPRSSPWTATMRSRCANRHCS